MPRAIQIILSVLILGLTGVVAGAGNAATDPAAQIVVDYNEAVTNREMKAAMALLADGGVQFHLHRAHAGGTAAD